jgi:hypothetical protein
MFTPGMLALRRASGGGGSGGIFRMDGDPDVAPTHLFSASVAGHIAIVDIQDPTNPSVTASYTTSYSFGAYGCKASCKDGVVYCCDIYGKIVAIDVSDVNTLGASQILGEWSDANLTTPQNAIVHPTKDVLWISNSSNNRVATIDISDPTNMTTIGYDAQGGSQGIAIATSKDGEYCYYKSAYQIHPNTLNASNEPIEGTARSVWNEAYSYAFNYQISPNDGEIYMAGGGNGNFFGLNKWASDTSLDWTTSVYDINLYDRPVGVTGLQYLPNYDGVSDSGWAVMARDDREMNIVTNNGTSITNQINYYNVYAYDVRSCDAYENYIYVIGGGYSASSRLVVFDWEGKTTMSTAATLNDAAFDDSRQVTLFAP